ncbi:MAG TPA: DNA helicase RecQ [Fusobacteriaceae bacterium]|nr:DNA helicase RecQ [Fusobacteriaceae bacterium]
MVLKAYEILKKYFGYTSFKEGQEPIIKNILDGFDTLGIMPTGGGKSICYQIPALIFDGITIVVSPLISLMQDQVDALNTLGISSIYINSTLKPKEMKTVYMEISNGDHKIIYVTPERFENSEFLDRIRLEKISQIAIDEAHCISQWGHDFRKSYLNVPNFIKQLPNKPIITAFTATATPKVREDIIKNLKFKPNVFINGFDRKNLKFTTIKGVNSLSYIKKYLKEHSDEGGIIYASTRKEVDSIYTELADRGYLVGKYHAGMSDIQRQQNQDDFINDRLTLMVATNAFGMGIDKSNVRFVIHSNLPKDLESYYQEAGRAGRDGLDAHCILIFNPKDIQTQTFFINNNQFESSEEIMNIKREKLSAMVNYCHTSKCVRSYILEYFGDAKIENCNNCSNCLDDGEVEDITIEVQKILSCVYRTEQRFGINMIVGVLGGSKNKSILNWNLDKSSTYGLLSDYSQKEIRALTDLLIGDEYLDVTKTEFPTLKLTKKAFEFIKNKEKLTRKITKIQRKTTYEWDGSFDLLRKLRADIAKVEKKPPYTIFSDKTLHEMARYLPTDYEGMLDISGVGEKKYERYGIQFLEVIKEIKGDSSPIEVINITKKDPKPKKASTKDSSHRISYQLFLDGKSITEIATIRKSKFDTILNHLFKCVDEKLKVDLSKIVDDGNKKLILSAIKKVGGTTLRAIKDELPSNIEYYEIKTVLKELKSKE